MLIYTASSEEIALVCLPTQETARGQFVWPHRNYASANVPEAERAGRVREAKEWLLSAADNQGRESAAALEQYFAAPPSTEARTVSTAQALAGIIADAQVGNTLIAAGQALGEAGVEGRTRCFR